MKRLTASLLAIVTSVGTVHANVWEHNENCRTIWGYVAVQKEMMENPIEAEGVAYARAFVALVRAIHEATGDDPITILTDCAEGQFNAAQVWSLARSQANVVTTPEPMARIPMPPMPMPPMPRSCVPNGLGGINCF